MFPQLQATPVGTILTQLVSEPVDNPKTLDALGLILTEYVSGRNAVDLKFMMFELYRTWESDQTVTYLPRGTDDVDTRLQQTGYHKQLVCGAMSVAGVEIPQGSNNPYSTAGICKSMNALAESIQHQGCSLEGTTFLTLQDLKFSTGNAGSWVNNILDERDPVAICISVILQERLLNM